MMKKITSIIQIIKAKHPTDVERHVAAMDREFILRVPPSYRNTETNQDYHMIAGGVAPPRGVAPGYACVVGVLKEDHQAIPAFIVLDEVQRQSLHALMADCVKLQELYGYAVSEELFQPWHGYFDDFSQVVTSFNDELRREKGKRWGFYPSPPAVQEESGRIQLYLTMIAPLLDPDSKRLYLGNAEILINALTNAAPEGSLKWNMHTCPRPILALGHVVYWIMQTQPWLRNIPRSLDLSALSDYERWELAVYGGSSDRGSHGGTIPTVE